jgi:cytoskeleton protein RodZ
MSFDLSRIGQALKAGREEQHLSLQQVSDVLFVRKRIIDAIESGDWSGLPHAVFVKGYIGQYAAFLGIQEQIEGEFTRHVIEPAPRGPSLTRYSHEQGSAGWGTRKKAVGFGAAVASIVVFLVVQNIQRPSYSVSPAHQPAPAVLKAVSGTPYQAEGDNVVAVAEAKKLMIACQQRTWVRVVIDRIERREFTMNPEEVIVLSGKEGFDLLIGNAGGVKLFYNGQDTGFSGEEGEVRRINLPEAG